MKDNWILITAGFSPESMVDAAKRVESQAWSLYPFKQVIRISKENIQTYVPNLIQKYPTQISDSTPGFGYAAWKTEAVYKALHGDFGPCDGVVWVDAGCELNSTFFTKLKFKKILADTIKSGHSVFALNTPEINFTKKAVKDLFPEANEIEPELQYQATYFALHGDKGFGVAEKMFNAVYEDFDLIDPTVLSEDEVKELILPKCEQSILSLIIKSHRVINRIPTPPAGNRGWKSVIRAITEPIWVSRNRTGKSLIPIWLRLIP